MKRLHSIAAELGSVFLLVAMAPILTAYLVANTIFSQAIQKEKSGALAAIADSAETRAESYVLGMIHDATSLAKSPELAPLLEAPQSIVEPDSALYEFLRDFTLEKGYHDLLLIDQRGNIRFSVKHEVELGQNVDGALLRGTQLATTVDAANTLLQTEVSNFAYYPPAKDHAAFLAAPLFDRGIIIGDVVLLIDNHELNSIVNRFGGLGDSGEILVAAMERDRLIITEPARHDDDLPNRPIDSRRFTPLVHALRGEAGSGEFLDHHGHPTLAVWRYLPSLNWGMLVKIDTQELYAPIQHFKQISLLVMLASMLLVMIGILLSNRLVSRPIVSLARTVRALREEALPPAIDAHGRYEIGELVVAFNALIASVRSHQSKLEDRVAQRTCELATVNQELRTTNNELESALQNLRQAQDQLIESEKMAALGGLVAGVAHEINTPVGITLTSATHLDAETRRTAALYQTGDLTENGLADYFVTAQQATQLMTFNSRRASDLIQSFKRVAVDQAGGERRTFDLAAYVDEVLQSMHPSLRKSRVKTRLECPAGLLVDSYPGALSQVLSNLIMNSIDHAFGLDRERHINIEARRLLVPDGWVELVYSDDGVGIPAELHAKVFEPFFTTRRGSGGSGLGLNVAFNIMRRTLKGTIELKSVVNEGTTFVLRFPSELPLLVADAR